jgi:hypothetical protein
MMRSSFLLFCGSALIGCETRERIAGPSSQIGVGPEVLITAPSQDLSLSSGTSVNVKGTVFDEEGIDAIYFNNLSDPGSIPPQLGGGVSQATFSILIDLTGAAGDTVVITVYAANLQHIRGDLVSRRIILR